jgi:hypothetical protein
MTDASETGDLKSKGQQIHQGIVAAWQNYFGPDILKTKQHQFVRFEAE